jgi:hypothetical protein
MTTTSNNLLEYAVKLGLVILLAFIVTHFIGVELGAAVDKVALALREAGN